MKPTLRIFVSAVVMASSLAGLAACERKPASTPPKPTTGAAQPLALSVATVRQAG